MFFQVEKQKQMLVIALCKIELSYYRSIIMMYVTEK